MSTTDIPLRCVDHVRFFVGNARQSAYFYRNAFGFDVVAYAGLETRVRHEAGYVLRQGEIAGPKHDVSFDEPIANSSLLSLPSRTAPSRHRFALTVDS